MNGRDFSQLRDEFGDQVDVVLAEVLDAGAAGLIYLQRPTIFRELLVRRQQQPEMKREASATLANHWLVWLADGPFDPLVPRAVRIDAIAQECARVQVLPAVECRRFNLAQHACVRSRLAAPAARVAALLHDAPLAILNNVRPGLLAAAGEAFVAERVHAIRRAILEPFGVDQDQHVAEVMRSGRLALCVAAGHIAGADVCDLGLPDGLVGPFLLAPAQAIPAFIARFNELHGPGPAEVAA